MELNGGCHTKDESSRLVPGNIKKKKKKGANAQMTHIQVQNLSLISLKYACHTKHTVLGLYNVCGHHATSKLQHTKI